MKIVKIFFNNGVLDCNGKKLATRKEYEIANRGVGSIFDDLHPGETVQLSDGYYLLDEDLKLIPNWQIV